MSSNESPIDEVKAFESGFNAYLHKSDMRENIVSIIDTLMKKKN